MSSPSVLSRVFEEDKPLDSSILWNWIRHYYTQGGVTVWSDGDVPFHITNTPVLAQEWTASVVSILRDFARMGLLHNRAPVEIFEVGPGTGRHAYFLLLELKRLQALTHSFCPGGLNFRLHLAELGAAGLESLAAHPNLREAIDDGDLILHQFDIITDSEPRVFYPASARVRLPSPNPVFVITNYILDSLPHDVLKVKDGEIFLGFTNLSVAGLSDDTDPTTIPNLGERIELTFRYNSEELKYVNPRWNQVLERYRALREETYVPFPTSSLRLAERACEWSKVATCFLVADKSFTTLEQLEELDEPELVPHGGGFSFNANLHAMGILAEIMGGRFHHTSSRDGTLDLSHLVFPASQHRTNEWDLIESEFRFYEADKVGSSRVDLQACKLEYSIVSPK